MKNLQPEFKKKFVSKILIVDDMSVSRKDLRRALTIAGEGYEIIEADSGKAALEAVDRDPPDIILLDVMMPEMDGFEVCRKLKADKEHKSIPILLLTAMDETMNMVKGFKLGASDYITKPIGPEAVMARIDAHLRIKINEKKLVEAENLKTIKNMIVTLNHNMNQPLAAAFLNINLLMTKLDQADKSYKTLENIKRMLYRMKTILKKVQSPFITFNLQYRGYGQNINY